MTYKDLKINVLQKVGDSRNIQNGEIILNTSTQTYISQIPNLLQEALNIVATAGRYIVKHFDIVNCPIQSVLETNMREIYLIKDKDMEVVGDNGKAYYFEVSGKSTIDIFVGEELQTTIENDFTDGFKTFKGKLINPLSKPVKIVFRALYPYTVKNIAIYDQEFETDEKVYDNVEYKRYNLRELTEDFYSLKKDDMPREAGINIVAYENNSDYYWEGDSTLVLDNNKKGVWRVYYNSYPQIIPMDITDDTVIDVLPEVAAVIPFYIAGQLLMSEDEDYSSERLNEFESRRIELMQVKDEPTSGNQKFQNTVGW